MSNTSSNNRPSGLHQRSSTQGTRQTRRTMERQPTTPLGPLHSSSSNAANTAQLSRSPTAQSVRESVRVQQSYLENQQTEKKAEDRFYVDNDYYSLNPWYGDERTQPLFSLGRPFPRTVRPGMLWGRKGIQEDDHQHDDQQEQEQEQGEPLERDQGYRKNRRGTVTLQIPPRIDEHGEYSPPPDRFEAEMDGRKYIVTRVGMEDDDQPDSESGSGRESQHRQELSEHDTTPDSMDDGSQVELQPLQTTQSTDTAQTAQTQLEKREIRQREQEAIQNYYNTYRNPLARLRARYPEAAAEFLATTAYLFFGIAGSLYSITYPAAEGDYITQSWAWGLAVTAGIYVGGGISGSHLSPWISITFSIYRGFPWKMCMIYCLVQMLSGFAAGALSWFIYRDAIMHIDPELTPSMTGQAFYSIPQDYVSVKTAFFNNFMSAALYTCVAFAIGDDTNTPPGSGMSALIYGLMTFLLCISFGYNGLGVSPARDLGPRFVAWWVGYGSETFSSGWWAYGPIGAGLSGTLTGALVYDVFIFAGGESPVNYHWPSPKEVKNRIMESRKAKGRVDDMEV